MATNFTPQTGPQFGPFSLCVSDNEWINASNNCGGRTQGGDGGDCFNVPHDEKGYSILTGCTRGFKQEKSFTLAALETYKIEFF